jgi:hypothetical protein
MSLEKSSRNWNSGSSEERSNPIIVCYQVAESEHDFFSVKEYGVFEGYVCQLDIAKHLFNV